MNDMPLILNANDFALRLALTVISGLALGYNRSEHGKAAGMRTTVLVCLAASAAMLQVNFLLPTAGKPDGSFITNDLMRLPLGILTGVGFIGGGVIFRRENMIEGVTTAATLWLATVIGLAFGGGQLTLGVLTTVIGLAVLWVLKFVEDRLSRQCRGKLRITAGSEGPTEAALRERLGTGGATVRNNHVLLAEVGARQFTFDISILRLTSNTETPSFVYDIASQDGIVEVSWESNQ